MLTYYRNWLEKPLPVLNPDHETSAETVNATINEESIDEKGDFIRDEANDNNDFEKAEDLLEEGTSIKLEYCDDFTGESGTEETIIQPPKKERKTFICEHCAKTFTRKKALDQHRFAVHENCDKHRCTICGKIFRWPGNLKTHMKVHLTASAPNIINFKTGFMAVPVMEEKTSDDLSGCENSFECPLCKEKCTTKLGFEAHYLNHRTVKVYNCDKCSKTFSHRSSLWQHKAIHTGNFPKCDVCGKKFTLKRSLKKHKETIHKRNKDILSVP